MSPSFKLKGSLFTLSVLQLLTTDLKLFEAELQAKIHLAPKFFNSTPMVLDIQVLENAQINFAKLKKILLNNEIIPVGIRGAKAEWLDEIRKLGFAILSDPGKHDKELPEGNATFNEGTKIIADPVRSGQRIYAEQGDLIIIGSVSSGAELLAEGNIHIYGALRGRALAGVNGNTEARIFCQQLAAELVAIAGQYQLFENPDTFTPGAKQVYLQNNQLLISAI